MEMTPDELKEHIENILKLTAIRLKDVYDNHKEMDGCFKESMFNSRLVFPKYRDGKTRVSEQELRFTFVEVFNEYCNLKGLQLYYSVETPTNDSYSGFSKGKPKVDPDGQSANFDLVVHEAVDKDGQIQLKRVCFIEFKAHSADLKKYKKDFLKLDNSVENKLGTSLRYFVNVFEKMEKPTISTLNKKIKDLDEYTSDETIYSTSKIGHTTTCFFPLDGNNFQLYFIPQKELEG